MNHKPERRISMSRFLNISRALTLLIGLGLSGCIPFLPTNAVSTEVQMESTATQPLQATATPSPSPAPTITQPTVETGESDLLKGIGIMGDSFYDEYQADDQRGGNYHALTFNLVEILERTRNFNLGPWGRWGEPRRTGYEFNWARSGATSQDMIDQGQHTGLAQQVAEGKVTFVFIGIGANDFSPYYRDDYKNIYNGQMTDQQLKEKIKNAISNVTLAVETVQQAGAKGIIVTLFTQWELDPLIGEIYPDQTRRQRVAKAIDAVNQGIQAMAETKGVVIYNQNEFGMKLLPSLQESRYLNVGGKLIDFLECGDKPIYSRLADQQHLGTVLSGVSANTYFIETMDKNFDLHIPLLSDQEILQIAGLGQ
jgi:hypothetical protein